MRERGKHVERTQGYSNDGDALRREFGIGPEVAELRAAGGLVERECGLDQTEWERADLGGLGDSNTSRERASTPSQVEETDAEEESVLITPQ